jgi:iron complex transport system substrate-binding protein
MLGLLNIVRRAVSSPLAAIVAALFAGAIAAGSAAASTPSDPPPDSIAEQFPPAADTSRIIPVTGDLAEVVYALGFGDDVVATDISATYPPGAADAPKIGYQRTLDAETILAFEPTLVLADDRAGPPEVFDALRAAGVEVVTVPYHADLEAPAYKVRAVAATLGVPDAGEQLVAEFEEELAAALAVADDGATAGGRPLVLALYVRGEQVQLAFGDGSGIDAVVEAAGGRDAGTEMGISGNAELSTEAIIEAAPDFLLVTTSGLDSVGGVDGLLAIPGVAETPAGADPEHRILHFDDQFLYGLGPRTGELVLEIATALHPSPVATSIPD